MKTVRTVISVALAAALSFGATSAMAKDGTYTSTTLGRNGDMTVQVVISGDKIQSVKVLDWSETHPIADLAKSRIPADVVKYQSTEVQSVSGATLTSFAMKAAVRDCLKQAGLDPNKFATRVAPPKHESGLVKEQADLVIVGAGGAGLSAAYTAASAGKRVFVVEKANFAGGNTSVSGGCFNVANPKFQGYLTMSEGQKKSIEALLAEKVRSPLQGKLIEQVKAQWKSWQAAGGKGMFDSPELHALQTWKAGDYKGNLELVYTLTREAQKTEKLLSDIGFKWQGKSTQFVGALWPRSNRASNFKSGVGYIDTYLDQIHKKNLPVTFFMSTRADDLIVKDGRVVGVKATGATGKTYQLTSKDGVILTTGGFSANVKMRNFYDTIWDKKLDEKVKTTNLPGITGDGIRMAQKVGANLIDMGYIQLLPTTDPQTGATNHKLAEGTCIYVNKNGKRFVNELGRRDELAKAALAQPDHIFFVISTEKTNLTDKNGRNPYGIKVADILRQKKAFKGATLDELAAKAGINAANLKETVAQWNKFCANPTGDPFGRTSCLDEHKLPGGPYYATMMTPSVHHTMGGVQINTKAQVLNTSGKVIPGLYAAGEVTGGIHGTNRVGCNAVPDALIFGRIAAENAIK